MIIDHELFRIKDLCYDALAKNLKLQGVPVWLDQWNIPHGGNWPREIERALSSCARLLLVLSPSSVESDEVQSEWLFVLDEKKAVVPILHQKCHIPFRLRTIQHIDFTSCSPDDGDALKDILIALGVTQGSFSEPEIPVPKEKTSVPYKSAISPEEAKAWSKKGKDLRA
jgi:TIR domain